MTSATNPDPRLIIATVCCLLAVFGLIVHLMIDHARSRPQRPPPDDPDDGDYPIFPNY